MKLIQMKVKPNARVPELRKMDYGTLHAPIKSPPVDGKACEVLISLVAAHF